MAVKLIDDPRTLYELCRSTLMKRILPEQQREQQQQQQRMVYNLPYDILVEGQRVQQQQQTLLEKAAEIQHERNKDMAVKLIDVATRQMPRSKIGKFTTLNDVQEALKMLANMPVGKAVQIDVDEKDYTQLKKDGTKDPARSIVNTLRRKFLNDGLPYKTYASSDRTITIMKEAAKVAKK